MRRLKRVKEFILDCDMMELIMILLGVLLFAIGLALAVSLFFVLSIQNAVRAFIGLVVGYVILSETIKEVNDERS